MRAALLVLWGGGVLQAPLSAQSLIDRVVALVDRTPVTLTDTRAAIGLGLIEASAETEPSAVQQMIDRQLLLIEVARFPPAEPPAAAVDREIARLRAAAGDRLASLMSSTGLTDTRLREVARDNLRIDDYIDQRFGLTTQASDDEAEQFIAERPAEFVRNGVRLPLDEALPLARERATAARRRAAIERWLQDLRGRARIAIPVVPSP